MKHIGLYLLVVVLSFVAPDAEAHDGDINGKVLDAQGKPLPYANIIVLGDKNSLIKAGYTNDDGTYDISAVPDGSYIVKVLSAGYITYQSGKVTVKNNNLRMPDIELTAKNNELKEVSVRAQKPFIEVRPDMLVVNVENSIMDAGSSAFEILQHSPGVLVDQNDNISLKGKPGVTIMINGKIQPISSADLANILKGLPANAIEKIELISNPSAKYDAAGTAGIINIVLKKDQHTGLNGSANIGYGQGVYPKANAGFNLNYRNRKFNVYASYNYAYRMGFNHLVLNRQFTDNDVTDFRYDEDHYAKFPYQSHTAAAGMDYNPTPKTSIGLALNGNMTHYTTDDVVTTHASNPIIMPIVTDSSAITYTKAKDKWNNYAVNLNFKHDFDSSGQELTVDLDYGRYWNENSQDLTTHFYAANADEMRIPYQLHGDANGLTQIRSLKADYTKPFNSNMKLEAGIKASYVTSDNEPLFYDETNGRHVYDSSKSDHFIYKEQINAAYFTFSREFARWSTQLGLRAEQTIVDGKELTTNQNVNRNYLQLFPSLMVQRHINADNDLGITLSRRIDRPDYRQLNPYKLYTDPTTYVQGNPYLDPALTYSAELAHIYKHKFVTSLTYSVTNNNIIQVLEPAPGRITIQTDENIGRMNYFGFSFAYPFRVTRWWNSTENMNAYYSQYIGNQANTNLNNSAPTFDVNSTNSFILPKDFSAELDVIYQAAQAYGFMHLEPQWWANIALQKNLWHKDVTIKLTASDVFFTAFTKATSYYNGYSEYFKVRRDMSQVNVSFIYRFGNRNVGQVRRHASGAADEMRRAGSAGG